MTEAAALCETFFTVWTNVFDRGGLKAGESFLVHGGSSGIGLAAAAALAQAGAEVMLVARREEELLQVAAAIQAQGGRATARPLDVTDLAAELVGDEFVAVR